MKVTKIELNGEGIRELLKSPEMQNICQEYANKAVGRLGGGYSSSVYVGKSRVNASVHADTYKARSENAKQNTILKAVFGK